MPIINQPPSDAISSVESGVLLPPNEGWRNFFSNVFIICNALTLSGTTARRPVTLLWVGRTFFDVTLGIPIWLRSISPTVWVNASGGVV